MIWKVKYLKEAADDFKKLSDSQRLMVIKAIDKVAMNPLPLQQGGYGKPLGNKPGSRLAGYMKIKLRHAGLRIIYKLVYTESHMLIIVIGVRANDQVYREALHRIIKNDQ